MKGELLNNNISVKSQILLLRNSRNSMIQVREDSWDEDKEEYTLPEPKSINVIGDKILKLVKNNHKELEIDFILETLSHLGWAPQLVYDDNGNWAIVGCAFAPTVMTASGKFEENVNITSMVEPKYWKSTIREALVEYLKD